MVNFINNNLASFFMFCFIASTLRNADCGIYDLVKEKKEAVRQLKICEEIQFIYNFKFLQEISKEINESKASSEEDATSSEVNATSSEVNAKPTAGQYNTFPGQYNTFPAPTESDCYKLLIRAKLIKERTEERTEGNEVKYLKHYSWANVVSSVLVPLCNYIQQDGVDNGKSVRIFSDLKSTCDVLKKYNEKYKQYSSMDNFVSVCNILATYPEKKDTTKSDNEEYINDFSSFSNTCDSLNTFKLDESGKIDPLNVEQFHKLCNIVYKLGDDDTQLPHAICADYKPISNMQPDTNHP